MSAQRTATVAGVTGGYGRDGYFRIARSGLTNCTGKRGDRSAQRERYRYALRNEAGMRGTDADALIRAIDAAIEPTKEGGAQ